MNPNEPAAPTANVKCRDSDSGTTNLAPCPIAPKDRIPLRRNPLA